MKRSEAAVLAFSALYVAAATPIALASSNQEFVFYIAVMLVLGGLAWAVHRRVGLTLATLWGLSLWGLAHMAGGLWRVSEETGVLYNLWLIPNRLKYDQVVHAYGFALSTWVCWQAVRGALRDPRPTPGLVILCALGGMGLGAVNEIVEFVATLTVPETNVGGYLNTGWDLVANATGATIAAVLILAFDRGAARPR
ncbi:MAG: DUF2238 domain-containing protein [Planctomycetota bacterium]